MDGWKEWRKGGRIKELSVKLKILTKPTEISPQQLHLCDQKLARWRHHVSSCLLLRHHFSSCPLWRHHVWRYLLWRNDVVRSLDVPEGSSAILLVVVLVVVAVVECCRCLIAWGFLLWFLKWRRCHQWLPTLRKKRERHVLTNKRQVKR